MKYSELTKEQKKCLEQIRGNVEYLETIFFASCVPTEKELGEAEDSIEEIKTCLSVL